jgi:hypothetical protein
VDFQKQPARFDQDGFKPCDFDAFARGRARLLNNVGRWGGGGAAGVINGDAASLSSPAALNPLSPAAEAIVAFNKSRRDD